MTDNALLIVAHGSRKEASNTEVKVLTGKIGAVLKKRYRIIKPSFLEFTEPSIEEGILECIGEGATEITILPYFLAAGSHVSHDIPLIIEKMQNAHPDVTLTLKQHVGAAPGMVPLLCSMV